MQESQPSGVLITERLRLRPLDPQDEQEIYALRSDERVNQFIDRSSDITLEDARRFIARIKADTENGASWYWAITLKNEDTLIGTACYWNLSPEMDQAEIGYELHPDFQGKGIMQEAIAKVIEFGFTRLNLKTITAVSAVDNMRSRKLLERNNFRLPTEQEAMLFENEDLAGMAVYVLNSREVSPLN